MHADAYLASLATAMGFDVARFDEPATTVVAGEDRRGERLVSHYRVGELSVVWSDPETLDGLVHWNGHGAALAFEQFRVWALEQGAEYLGSGYEHVLASSFEAPPTSATVLDGDDPAVAELAGALIASCTADDVAASDFNIELLDEHLAGCLSDGSLRALAGGRPFEMRPGFHDIGALVHPESRRQGLGRQVVAAVVSEILAAGGRPLYRCEVGHERSWRLCRGLGFVVVGELEAFRWPAS